MPFARVGSVPVVGIVRVDGAAVRFDHRRGHMNGCRCCPGHHCCRCAWCNTPVDPAEVLTQRISLAADELDLALRLASLTVTDREYNRLLKVGAICRSQP